MTPAARIAAVIEILAEMQAANAAGALLGRQAEQWLRAGLQRRRYAGSGDRAAVGDLFWKIQRGRARLGWHLASIDAPANPRNLALAALVLMEQKSAVLPQLFSAEIAHAPAPLDVIVRRRLLPCLKRAILLILLCLSMLRLNGLNG